MNELPSLLWPHAHDRSSQSQGVSEQQAIDLGLDVLARVLDWDGRQARFVRATLLALVADPLVIAYRQAIAAELHEITVLRAALTRLLPRLAEMSQPRSAAWTQESPLLLVPPRVSDLELYVTCINDLFAALDAQPLRSTGLRALHEYAVSVRADSGFQALTAELPLLREQLDQIASITIGVNLDRDLRPQSATLVEIHRERFTGPRTLIHRLLGRQSAGSPTSLTALHRLTERSPATDPLAHDLQKVLEEVVQPVANALESYQRINARPLAALAPELSLLLGAAQMADRLHALGLPTCLPTPSATAHRLDAAYNPSLALQIDHAAHNGAAPTAIVTNPIDFDLGRIMFVTGPNRGGKTTYLRAIGLNQILFQAGVFVAAREAQMTPVDAILTHFPPVEGVEPGVGRLDDEARRVRAMFAHATPRSLLLFNEPLTSTGEGEALLLAEDVLRALRLLNARTVYVTHLHALADELAALNAGDGARIVSWVAGVDETAARTYLIRPGQPSARSHAATIAQQHGITFAQLARQLADRGVVPAPPTTPPA